MTKMVFLPENKLEMNIYSVIIGIIFQLKFAHIELTTQSFFFFAHSYVIEHKFSSSLSIFVFMLISSIYVFLSMDDRSNICYWCCSYADE